MSIKCLLYYYLDPGGIETQTSCPKSIGLPSVVVQDFKTEATQRWRQVLFYEFYFTKQIPGQPGIHSETLSQKQTSNGKQTKKLKKK